MCSLLGKRDKSHKSHTCFMCRKVVGFLTVKKIFLLTTFDKADKPALDSTRYRTSDLELILLKGHLTGHKRLLASL